MRMGRISWLLTILALFCACVTVNVYFPAAEVQRAANDFTRDIYGPDGQPSEPPKASVPQTHSQADTPARGAIVNLLDVAMPEAQAAADLTVSSPKIVALRKSMKARNSVLSAYYLSGAIGINRNGLLSLREAGATSKGQVAQLVTEDNADREALYREIAAVNGHPEWLPEIQKTFAQSWVENAPAGVWFEVAPNAWRRK